MKQKKRIAFFPVFADTLPIIRFVQRYCSDVEITELLSPPGSCCCGKDASFLDNREAFGMIVKVAGESNPELWEELYLLSHEVLGLDECEIQTALYDPMISIALSNGKKVRITSDTNESKYLVPKKQGSKRFGVLSPIKKYVVFVGGIIREANSLEVFLRVFGELRKHIRVVAFSSAKNVEICDALSLHGILYDRNYLESERVFAINNFILNAIREFDAELVLIHVDEALMSFNNSMTNGFGTVPYMVSQVISPDFSICCLPCDYANPEFINGFVQGLEGRYCFSPDVWHVSNVFLDTAVAIDAQDANAVYAPIDSIYKMIQNQKEYGLTIGSMLTEQFLSKCTNDIMKEWRESQLVEVVN